MEFIIKNIPTKYVILGNNEVDVAEVTELLGDFEADTQLSSYNLNTKVADILVEEGVLEKLQGVRLATLYRKTDKFDSFYCRFWQECYGV